jgi:hypothetical protein
MRTVEDALYDTVHDYPGGVDPLAKRMGLAPSTLQNMANPNLPECGWSLKRFRQAIAFTGDTRAIDALCGESGGVFVKTGQGAIGDDQILEVLSRLGKEFGEVCASLHKSLADGKLTEREFKDFNQQLYELNQVSLELGARMEAKVERRPVFKVAGGGR